MTSLVMMQDIALAFLVILLLITIFEWYVNMWLSMPTGEEMLNVRAWKLIEDSEE